jgi:magnesium transporter
MISIYYKQNNSILKLDNITDKKFEEEPVWIDLYNMTREEELYAESIVGINIPSLEEMKDIELSSRLYHRDGAVNMTASIVVNALSEQPELSAITFVIYKNTVITVRYSDPIAFHSFSQLFLKLPFTVQNAGALFVDLVDAVIEKLADSLESVGKEIDSMSRQIFLSKNIPLEQRINFKNLIEKIGIQGDILSKICESLVTLNRVMSYAQQSSYVKFSSEVVTDLSILVKDIIALNDHAIFLSNKVSFLLDATLGMINLEQNNIIKIFSIATVISIPPMIIAGIYGMNFHNMPELNWIFGYPLTIGLMIFSSWAPYKYFKKKKWL